MNNQIRNDGFKYPKLVEKDYILGAERSAPFHVINQSGNWLEVLPTEEVQRNDKGDTNGCTNYGTTSQLECLLDYLFGVKDNFSERFQAVISEQQRDGNDPQNVYESIRKVGVVKDQLLPFTDDMTFEEYLSPNPMTPELIAEAGKFLEEYDFKHEYIYDPYDEKTTDAERRALLVQALKRSPVGVSVYAWVADNEGTYIKPEGTRDNHWTLLVAAEEGKYWYVFDTYPPHVKKLKWDDPWFDVAKGIWVKKKVIAQPTTPKVGLLALIKKLIKWLLCLK